MSKQQRTKRRDRRKAKQSAWTRAGAQMSNVAAHGSGGAKPLSHNSLEHDFNTVVNALFERHGIVREQPGHQCLHCRGKIKEGRRFCGSPCANLYRSQFGAWV